MCNPAPYSVPKRGLVDPRTVRLRTKKGSFVYAPHGGTLSADGGLVTVTTDSGYKHVITNCSAVTRHKIKVKTGERIALADGRTIRYKRYNRNGKKVDALPIALRDDSRLTSRRFFPRAKRLLPTNTSGVMGPGTEVKVVWHTSESDPASGIAPVADWVQKQGSQYHIIWNPYEKDSDKQFVQFYQYGVGSRAMKNYGSYPTNRHGKYCIQICVIGRAKDAPLANSPMYGRRHLMEWLDGLGIPRKLIFSQSNPTRTVAQWEKSGHGTHRVAPGNDHVDPGYIDTRKLFGP